MAPKITADCHLYKLPNELLLYLLTPIPTPELLPLTLISHRIYALILRILQNRLVAAAELHSHSLLLECYQPSAKLTEPSYFCSSHGTHGLCALSEHDTSTAARLGEMRSLYSRFRPYRRELETGDRRVRGPPGDVPGSRTFPGTASDRFEGETVRQTLSLDGDEWFTQLVAQTKLVKIGPRNGLYTSSVEIEEGVLRVWRKWLRRIADKGLSTTSLFVEPVAAKRGVTGEGPVRDATELHNDVNDERILWVTPAKNTGIRFNVREPKLRRDVPILVRTDEEDMHVSYDIEYDELLIRTSHLLLMLEKSLVQEDNSSGKAVVFGSFG
ncbi:F-box domain-containing protein [Massariosphaeria phaeospora]|uniref:F-box domain-containing protein n=1 Tax=Massariosphaeria phaeospora TaxID=100035 RepID=A0A7C8IIR3_9PLEO|nr:F-box domain-containing protein [Massariosphaeria phaeospora]